MINNQLSNDRYIFYIETVQSGAFRILIEALKEILTDGNITIDSNGIKLIAMDSTHSVLIHLKLESENFEFFQCSNKITIGVNMLKKALILGFTAMFCKNIWSFYFRILSGKTKHNSFWNTQTSIVNLLKTKFH